MYEMSTEPTTVVSEADELMDAGTEEELLDDGPAVELLDDGIEEALLDDGLEDGLELELWTEDEELVVVVVWIVVV